MFKRCLLFYFFSVCVCLSSELKAEDEVAKWNNQAIITMKNVIASPPKESRDLAIIHIAVFDTLNSIERAYSPIYSPWLKVAYPVDPNVAVAAAAHRSLSILYPSQQSEFDSLLALTISNAASVDAANNAIALGETVADIILAWRADDGWDAESGYIYDSGTPGKWRPSLPFYADAVEPHWANLTPFGMIDPDTHLPPPPPALNSPEYAAALNEVKELGSSNSTTRTEEQSLIAEFWNDTPGLTASPAGKWNLITQVLTEQFDLNLIDKARAFALVNITLADASIVAWRAKYTYDLWRPIDAIRLADTDGNPDTIADPNWLPNWPTPAFPEYVSGHSTFSAAAATMLELVLGTNDVQFAVAVGFDILPGVERLFDTIWAAAEEAGRSRIYGGVHFQFGNTAGLDSGLSISADTYDRHCLINSYDINRDNLVDMDDFIALCENWLATSDTVNRLNADINFDRIVDYADFAILVSQF